MTGLKSSFPEAKIVEFIAFKKSSALISVSEASWITISLGNSAPSRYANEYLPLSAEISIVFLSDLLKVRGWSAKVFKISNNSFADIAILSLLSD